MNFGRIRGVNKPVSRILLGTAVSPMLLGQDADEMLDAAFESGINAFDTARNYGGAERSLGRWLKARGVRKDAVILSKCGHPDGNGSRVNERAIRDDLSRSLEELQTDDIDIYLLHRDDERVPVGEIVELFNQLKREGRSVRSGAPIGRTSASRRQMTMQGSTGSPLLRSPAPTFPWRISSATRGAAAV